MRRREMGKNVLFFLFILMFFPSIARAQEHVLPEEIRNRVWIIPDCKTPLAGFFYGRRFALQLSPGGHLVQRYTELRPAQSGPGAWEIKLGEEGFPTALRARDDGTLLFSIPISVPFANIDQPARAEEDNDFVQRLPQCPDLPAAMVVDDDMKAAFAAFERADEICAGKKIGSDEACRRAVFDIGDVDVSGDINEGELMRLWDYTAWLAEGRTCNADTPFPPAHGADDGKKFAARALSVADGDKNGALTLKEIEVFQPAFAVTDYGVKLRDMLAAVTLPMAWLSPAP